MTHYTVSVLQAIVYMIVNIICKGGYVFLRSSVCLSVCLFVCKKVLRMNECDFLNILERITLEKNNMQRCNRILGFFYSLLRLTLQNTAGQLPIVASMLISMHNR